jgi:hypothetical protein
LSSTGDFGSGRFDLERTLPSRLQVVQKTTSIINGHWGKNGMGAVAAVADVGFAESICISFAGGVVKIGPSYDDLVHQAVTDVKVVQDDIRNLPKNLIEIFDKYATKDKLGSEFTPVDGVGDSGYDIEFISEVLTECFSFVGNGSFAEVFDLGPKWVLKVNCRDNEFSPVDGGFGWMKTCTKHQGNPYVPNIASMEQRGHLYVAVVEHLHLGVGLSFEDGSLGDLADVSYADDFDINAYVDDAEFTFGQFIKHSPKDAIKVARIYEDHRMHVRGCDDISTSNVMHRDGFPVLTDPICDTREGFAQLGQGTTFSWMSNN